MISAASEASDIRPSDAEPAAAAAPDPWDELAKHNRGALHAMIATVAADICRDLESATDGSLKSLMAAVRVDDMKGVDLSFAKLRGEDLSGIQFTGANLTGADLRGCDASKCNFTRAILDEVRWEGANLQNATFDADKLEAVLRAAAPVVSSRGGRVIDLLAQAAGELRKPKAAKPALKIPDPVLQEPAAKVAQAESRVRVRVATPQP